VNVRTTKYSSWMKLLDLITTKTQVVWSQLGNIYHPRQSNVSSTTSHWGTSQQILNPPCLNVKETASNRPPSGLCSCAPLLTTPLCIVPGTESKAQNTKHNIKNRSWQLVGNNQFVMSTFVIAERWSQNDQTVIYQLC